MMCLGEEEEGREEDVKGGVVLNRGGLRSQNG
jgi:hypothetical protein